ATIVHEDRGPPADVVLCRQCEPPVDPDLVLRGPPTQDVAEALLFPDLLRDSLAQSRRPRLLVAVSSWPARFAQRQAIRFSWGRGSNDGNGSFRIVFFLGCVSTGRVMRNVKPNTALVTNVCGGLLLVKQEISALRLCYLGGQEPWDLPPTDRGPPADVVLCRQCEPPVDPTSCCAVLPPRDVPEALLFPDLLRTRWPSPAARLLVAVSSWPARFAQRQPSAAAGERGSNDGNGSFRIVFFLGCVSTGRVMLNVKLESRNYGDMVVEKTWGTYDNRASISVLLLEWVLSHAYDSQLVLKVHDDTYVNVGAVLDKLDWFSESTGDLFGRVTLERGPDGSRGLSHLEDCAYFIKTAAFVRMQREVEEVPTDDREEVFITGKLARRANLTLVHVDDLGPCRAFSGVQLNGGTVWLTRHPVLADEMQRYFERDFLHDMRYSRPNGR
ncbi:hypothetical protein HPB47_003600, partial [Ixodes persulcatus]